MLMCQMPVNSGVRIMQDDIDDIPVDMLLDEVEALIKAWERTTDEKRSETIAHMIKEILDPLVNQEVPRAKWLYAAISGVWNNELEEYEKKYWMLVKEAADAGNPEAQFRLACELDYNDATKLESANYFKLAAEQGFAYAEWCHGLNISSGLLAPPNPKEGLKFIISAANKKFEGAIQFLIDAYANGIYGFEKNEQLSLEWRSKLKDKDIIRY